MTDPEFTAQANRPPSDGKARQPITFQDVLRAVFFPLEEAQSASLPALTMAAALTGLTAKEAGGDVSGQAQPGAPTAIIYEQRAITPYPNAMTRRVLTLGLGTVLAVASAYIAQSALTSQQNTTTATIFYGLGALIWLGLLAFEFAPPDGGILSRGPSIVGGGPARPLVTLLEGTGSLTRSALALASLTLSMATYVFTANNTFTSQGIACWLLSIIGWVLVAAERRPEQVLLDALSTLRQLRLPRPKLPARHWVALGAFIAVLAAAIFFRFYQLDSIPGEMTSDHVEKLLDAYDVSQGQFHVFFPRNGGREAIQMYLVAATAKLAGTGLSHLTLKLVTAVEALLLIPLIIFLGHELVDWETGFFAAALLAISWWDTSLGRLGLRIVLTPLIFTLLLITLIRGTRTGSRQSWVWAGIWMGVGVYAYQALRMVPLVALFAWVVAVAGPVASAISARRRRLPNAPLHRSMAANVLARQTLNLACAGLVSVAIFVPLLRFWHDDPASLWNRVVNRTTSNEVPIQGSPTQIFADNFIKALGMFNVKGDVAWISAPPNAPALDIITGGLLVLGLCAWLARIRIRRDPVDWFLLAGGVIMLLPSALAIAFPIENPSVTRASGAIPVVFVLAAWPLALIRQRWTAVIGRRAGLALAGGLTAILLAASATYNYKSYFEDFATSYRLSALNPGEVARAVRQIIGPKSSLDGVWLIGWPFWHDYRAIGIDAGDVTFKGAILDYNTLKDDLDKIPEMFALRPQVFILNDEDIQSRDLLQQRFPTGSAKHFVGVSPKHNFYLFVVPAP